MVLNTGELLNSFKIGICLIDTKGKVIFLNTIARNIFHLQGKNIANLPYQNLIFPHINPKFRELHKLPLVLAMQKNRKFNYMINLANQNIPINCLVSPMLSSTGKVVGGMEVYVTDDVFPNLGSSAEFQKVANMYLSNGAKEHIKIATKQSHNTTTAMKRFRSLVFIDLVGFTTLSEQLDAHDVIQILNIYYDRLNITISSYQGDIDKFIGDALLIVFENAEAAVRCSTDIILKDLPLINQQVSERYKSLAPITIHVGVNTGWVIIGEMGARTRKDYTVIGDNVNIAARIQGLAPPNEVWISGKTLANIGAMQNLFEETEKMSLKGKKQPLALHKFLPERLEMAKRVVLFEKGESLQTEMKVKLRRMGVKDITIVETEADLEREAVAEYDSMVIGSSVKTSQVSAIQKILQKAGKDPNMVIAVSNDVSTASLAALEKLGIKTVVKNSDDQVFDHSMSGALRSQTVNKIERKVEPTDDERETQLEEEQGKALKKLAPLREGYVLLPVEKNFEVEFTALVKEENLLALKEDIERLWIYKSNRNLDSQVILDFDKLPQEQVTIVFLQNLIEELSNHKEMHYQDWKKEPVMIRSSNDIIKNSIKKVSEILGTEFLIE